MVASTRTYDLDLQTVLDSMAQAVLVFAADGALALDNVSARRLLGPNLARIRAGGWQVCAALLDAGRDPDTPAAEALRAQTLASATPVPFTARLGGALLPGSMAAIYGESGQVLTQVCLQVPDWTPLTRIMDVFRAEASTVIDATRGHADLIVKLLKRRTQDLTADKLAAQVIGFTEVIASHLYRLDLLMGLLSRMERVVTGTLAGEVAASTRRVALDGLLEDLVEELFQEPLVDPESGRDDCPECIALNVPRGLDVAASPLHLRQVMLDLLRNAVLYSEYGAPVFVQAARSADGRAVRIDVIDRGCGVRAREAARVFEPFQRARQPQVLAQFGYGLSLYLARAEIEAMGGRLWFESEEGMGATFSVRLPIWDEARDDEEEPDT